MLFGVTLAGIPLGMLTAGPAPPCIAGGVLDAGGGFIAECISGAAVALGGSVLFGAAGVDDPVDPGVIGFEHATTNATAVNQGYCARLFMHEPNCMKRAQRASTRITHWRPWFGGAAPERPRSSVTVRVTRCAPSAATDAPALLQTITARYDRESALLIDWGASS
jgi:hypothetical protein